MNRYTIAARRMSAHVSLVFDERDYKHVEESTASKEEIRN